MKIKFITADGCERYEERAFPHDKPEPVLRRAFAPRLLTPYPALVQNIEVPVFYRIYELVCVDVMTTGNYSCTEVAVYVEKL